VGVADYADEVVRFHARSPFPDAPTGGYLLQELLHPHPRLAEVCGDRVSGIRVIVICDEAGPEIIRATWKLTIGDNPADNFWRKGNALAAVDVATGRVLRVVRGVAIERQLLETHPDTDAQLVGLELPDWGELRRVVLAAASAVSRCPLQGWDVVLSDRGPVLLELEPDGGHPNIPQHAYGEGLYQGRFKELVDRQAVRSAELRRRLRRNKFRRPWRREASPADLIADARR
jgi:hypothetical protein